MKNWHCKRRRLQQRFRQQVSSVALVLEFFSILFVTVSIFIHSSDFVAIPPACSTNTLERKKSALQADGGLWRWLTHARAARREHNSSRYSGSQITLQGEASGESEVGGSGRQQQAVRVHQIRSSSKCICHLFFVSSSSFFSSCALFSYVPPSSRRSDLVFSPNGITSDLSWSRDVTPEQNEVIGSDKVT